jgi:hypothetical protein
MAEYFIAARSFAAPFVSDESTGFAEAATPVAALEQFAARYTHPCGLYAAEAYESAEAYHKGRKAVAQWLSNHARRIVERQPTMVLSHGPGKMELDGKATEVKDPKGGHAKYVVAQDS